MKDCTLFKMQKPGKSILVKSKLHGLGMFVMILGLASFSFGQTMTTTVATPGGNETGTSGYNPIQGDYAYSYSQQIYLATEFNAAVQGQPNRITKIRFFYVSGPFAKSNNWTVYMGGTAKTEFTSDGDWVPLANMQQVYTGILPAAPVPDTWMEITLTTPFQWDGVSNIVVAVDENQPSYVEPIYWRIHNAGPNRAMSYGNDADDENPDPASPPNAFETTADVPQAQFVHEIAAAACNLPPNQSVTGLTATTANISWTAPSPAPSGGYEYVLSTADTEPTAGGTSISGTVYNASALVPNTDYYFFVRSACGSGSFSSWANIAFTTLAIPCVAPTSPAVSAITSNSATISWTTPSPVPSGGYEYVLSTTNTTPTAGGTSISGTTYNASALVPNTNYYFFVRSACGNGNFSSWVSVSFTTLAVPCTAPTSPAVSGITATTANIGWTAPTPAPSGGYEYVLSTTNTTPTAGGTSISATVYNASALVPNTNYYFFVRAACGSGSFSGWASIPFKTMGTSGVEDLEAILGLSIFPNPAGEMITVTVNESTKVKQISLRNITGALILSVKATGNKETFSLAQLAAGAYLMEIETDRGTLTKQFHVIH